MNRYECNANQNCYRKWVEVVVVVRERKTKDFIVTAYIKDNLKKKTTKAEISREIW